MYIPLSVKISRECAIILHNIMPMLSVKIPQLPLLCRDKVYLFLLTRH